MSNTDPTPAPPGNDISREHRGIVEQALFAVARNVAKHIIGRDGWHEQDECFKVDLREQQGRIEALIVGLQAERDVLKARAEAAEARVKELEAMLHATEKSKNRNARIEAVRECERIVDQSLTRRQAKTVIAARLRELEGGK